MSTNNASSSSSTSPNTNNTNNTDTDTSDTTNRVEWTDEQTIALIEQRRSQNYEYYYSIPGRSRKRFWSSVVENVNRTCRCDYSGRQYQTKFSGRVTNYHVS